MKRIYLLSFLIIFTVGIIIFWPDAKLKADDRQIFSGATKPYVMLLLDISSTMFTKDFQVAEADLANFKNYTTSTGEPFSFVAPYIKVNNKWGYYATRLEALKRSTIQILDVFRDKAKLGLSYFFFPPNVNYQNLKPGYWTSHPTTWHPPVLQSATYDAAEYGNDGAIIRIGISDLSNSNDPTIDAAHDADLDAMCIIVKNLRDSGSGSTPIAESMDTIYGYFKGLISDTTNFPNTWTDRDSNPRIPTGSTPPEQYSCQQNYIIIVTDGLPTNDAPYHYTRSNTTNGDYVWNYSTTTNYTVVKCHDYSHPYTKAIPEPAAPMVFDGLNWDNSSENNSKDVQKMAKWLYDNPIKRGAGQTVGIRTWAIGMKLPIGGSADLRLKEATDNAHGHGIYKNADDFNTLTSNLIDALESINLSVYAFSAYTSPKKITSVSDDNYVSYSGFFLNKDSSTPIWEGHLQCLEIKPSGTTYEFDKKWDASTKMYTQGESTRKLYTRYASGKDAITGKITYTPIEFKSTIATPIGWPAMLAIYGASTTEDLATANKVIQYIRGDATTRGVKTETSSLFLLADIFHSDVIYVGKPMKWKWIYNTSACDKTATTTDSNCFQYFYKTNLDRQKVVYVGTNDGVVHTINAEKINDGGKEISGFIPDAILPKLQNIAINKDYTYTADGRMTSADIYSPADHKWKTILAYGLREGGKYYYCQDVTNPGTVGSPVTPTVNWQFPQHLATGSIIATSSGNDAIHQSNFDWGVFEVGQIIVNEKGTCRAVVTAVNDKKVTIDPWGCFKAGDRVVALDNKSNYIGETWGKPVLGRIKYKKGSSGTTTEAWVAILAGGYGDGTNNEGKALFIVDADSGDLIWHLAYANPGLADSNDYYKKNIAQLNYPIPQSVTAVDLDNDLFIDTIYFGNTGGNLFKLDIFNPLTSSWIPKLLFERTAGTQPIYLAPSVSYDQCYKLWVHFGTGDRKNPQSAPTGQFIAIMDDITATTSITTGDLQKLIWNSDKTGTTTTDKTKKGWYFDFLDAKEIIMEPDPVIIPDENIPYLYFNTYQPAADVISGDPCGKGGNMHVYTIKLPLCFSKGDLISGEREDARLAGGGLLIDEYLQWKNEAGIGSTTPKGFKKYHLKYPGGVYYFKEIIR